jgi:hypothetical protein
MAEIIARKKARKSKKQGWTVAEVNADPSFRAFLQKMHQTKMREATNAEKGFMAKLLLQHYHDQTKNENLREQLRDILKHFDDFSKGNMAEMPAGIHSQLTKEMGKYFNREAIKENQERLKQASGAKASGNKAVPRVTNQRHVILTRLNPTMIKLLDGMKADLQAALVTSMRYEENNQNTRRQN